MSPNSILSEDEQLSKSVDSLSTGSSIVDLWIYFYSFGVVSSGFHSPNRARFALRAFSSMVFWPSDLSCHLLATMYVSFPDAQCRIISASSLSFALIKVFVGRYIEEEEFDCYE